MQILLSLLNIQIMSLEPLIFQSVAWLYAAIHEVAKSWTRLSDWTELNWTEIYVVVAVICYSGNRKWRQMMSLHVLSHFLPVCLPTQRIETWNLHFPEFLAAGVLIISVQFNSVQSLSHVRLFATPWIAARQASLSITNSRSSLKLMSIESVMPSSHLILCCPLFLLPPIPPSIQSIAVSASTSVLQWTPRTGLL